MSKVYKGYCPFCDEGFSAENVDIYYVMGNSCIKCPNCEKDIIIPTWDSNNSDSLNKDELHTCLNNPNFFKLEEES